LGWRLDIRLIAKASPMDPNVKADGRHHAQG
jgi:hypothetical protein